MNIVEIIKKVPEDHVYWCTLIGECKVRIATLTTSYPIIAIANSGCEYEITKSGRYFYAYPYAECVLFPSRDNRDWAAFERELDGKKEQHTSTAGSLSAYCHEGDVVEINLDHEFYQKEHPYVNIQIDGYKYPVPVALIKLFVLGKGKAEIEKEQPKFVPEDGNSKYYVEDDIFKDAKLFTKDNFNGSFELTNTSDRPMMAAIICAGLLAGGCKDKGAALINKAVNYADMILEYTKEESNDKC